MDSSELLEERNEVDMEIEREGEQEININDLDSYLNSVILKSKTKISYCRQAKTLIGNIANAKTEISILNKAKENLEQKNEELKGQIQSASNENLTLKNKNEQFNKEIEDLLEYKRQNQILLQSKENQIEENNKEIRSLQAKNNKLNKTAITEKNTNEESIVLE